MFTALGPVGASAAETFKPTAVTTLDPNLTSIPRLSL